MTHYHIFFFLNWRKLFFFDRQFFIMWHFSSPQELLLKPFKWTKYFSLFFFIKYAEKYMDPVNLPHWLSWESKTLTNSSDVEMKFPLKALDSITLQVMMLFVIGKGEITHMLVSFFNIHLKEAIQRVKSFANDTPL